MTVPAAAVRPALVADAEAFTECHVACWREAYATLWGENRLEGLDLDSLIERRRDEISAGEATHMLAERDGEVIGVAIAGATRDEEPAADLELYAIYVRAAHYGTGVSTQLLDKVLEGQPAALWTYRDNPRASAFYINQGFIPDGTERNDSSGIRELRMVRRQAVPRRS